MDTPQSFGKSQWIGRPVARFEDRKLLIGAGSFADDASPPGLAFACFVRSPHPHARLRSIDTTAARAAPGVLAVLTGSDAAADRLGPLPYFALHKRHDGSEMTVPPRLALAAGVVRFVGEPVVLVVAETRNAAKDAAELVEVDYEPLPAVVDLPTAGQPDSPVVWAPAFDPALGNLGAAYHRGDPPAEVSAAIAAAAHRVRIRAINNRVVANPIEVNSAIGAFDAATGRYTLRCPNQNILRTRTDLVAALGVDATRIRVVTEQVGGGFGARSYAFPEYVAILWASARIGRPVKWLAERSELFTADVHGRDQVWEAEIAFDADLRIAALRVLVLANLGAYVSFYGAAIPAMSGARAVNGCYRVPLVDHEVRMLFTHTAPVDAYRGAGRPEMGYLLERLMHKAAIEIGVDPIELKRRNLIRRDQMPYTGRVGFTYECGDFASLLAKALAAIDWEGHPARRVEAARRGMLLGRGIANYVEVTGSGMLTEEVDITVLADGTIRFVCGTQSIGQGLSTAFAQIAAEKLEIDPALIEIIEGDSDVVRSGGGAGGSRGLQVGGNAVMVGAAALVDRGRELAASALEASAADIEYREGVFRIAGTDRAMSLGELAQAQPAGVLVLSAKGTATGQTWPNGCQAAEVEVDPETGHVKIVRMVAVDDIGTVINPLVAHGQIHGGIAQGVGQALLENVVYDSETGQLLTGSFLDYAMPRADDLPSFTAEFDESCPSAFNSLGAKGAGESGTHGAIPAVVNAVVDALSSHGITHLDIPLTGEKVWRALQG